LRRLTAISALIVLSVIFTRCGEDAAFEKHITEGVIEFDVTYPEMDSNNLMLEMLPDKMVLMFKDDRYKSELKTAGGIVEMAVISDASKQRLFNMIKLFSDRYVLELDQAGAKEMTNVLPPFTLKTTSESSKLADARCTKIILDFNDPNKENYEFFYTDDIELKNPNWFTPYSDITGVLLDYQVDNYGMHMRLKATKIIPQEIDTNVFHVNDNYRNLNKEEFDALVVKNMEVFLE